MAILAVATGRPDAPSDFGNRRSGAMQRALWRLADDRRFGPLTRARLRMLVGRLAPGPFDIEAEAIRLRAYPAENHSDRVAVARGRLPDRDERAAIAPYLPEGGVFVDVGANVGLYSLWAALRVGPSGTVLAIEPHPQTAERLAFNIAANGLANVRLLTTGIGAVAGTARLHSSAGGNVGQSSLLEDVAFRPDGAYEIAVHPLLTAIREAGLTHLDVLKVDVEGYEDRVIVPFLRDAPQTLLPRAVLVETDVAGCWASDCLAALQARGYDAVLNTAANAVLARTGPA
ncbi:FkbM family methyltransferase [Tepidamorphus gemmatus]|uniref:FkbM family methyltransferase n=1 Tax=Tepidamorphus gemmatus TaxID=747076 RepID=A0A4V2UZY4_9HYPH|nr:FkbM family methyltransferase [Tepidamorphus gemmatus]TCT13149.1 FkbM family methyltransferase [Tepidamorphus gemmatus]